MPITESEARGLTIVVLLVLAGIWTAVLLPPYLEKRRSIHPSTSIVDFRHKLAVLQRTGDPYAPMPVRPTPGRAMTRRDALRRRRDVLATLAAAAVLTFLLAAATGGASVWLLHLTVDASLLGYVALLMQVQQQRYAPAPRMRAPRAGARQPRLAPAGFAAGYQAAYTQAAYAAPAGAAVWYPGYEPDYEIDIRDGGYGAAEADIDTVYRPAAAYTVPAYSGYGGYDDGPVDNVYELPVRRTAGSGQLRRAN